MEPVRLLKYLLPLLGLCLVGSCVFVWYSLSPKEMFNITSVSPDQLWRCHVVTMGQDGRVVTTVVVDHQDQQQWRTLDSREIQQDSLYPNNPSVLWVSNTVVVTDMGQVWYSYPLPVNR